jgi:ribonucleoside-diphosphate reductase alpha chain
MNLSNKLLSNLASLRSYAKHLPHAGRRESLTETINRNMSMHLERFPSLSKDILKAYRQVHDLHVMPSMRSLQFGGEAILKNNARIYNCSFVNVTYERVFAEILYLLLCGVGVGFSVQQKHIAQLPPIRKPKEEGVYYAHDNIEGWSECVNQLMCAYFYGGIRPIFNLTNIRPKGSALVTIGAKAPGPEPLRILLGQVEEILKQAIGRKLTALECHDIICIIADGVLAGGIRRAALISLFDKDNTSMLTCKHGEWWVKHPYRARANNSAILEYKNTTQEEFNHVFDMCIKSNSGEPGFSWTHNSEQGFNPCHEINLNSNQFCNLSTINLTGIKNEKDFHNRVYAAALLGTLQATYTDFPYLSNKWKEVTEKEALLGVSFTGIADANDFSSEESLEQAAKLVLEVNEKYAKKLGINPAARATAIKPEGTSSCVMGSSSGVHARFSKYYLRRVRLNKDDSLAKYFKSICPELIEDDLFSSSGAVITIPQKSPDNAILRENETAIDLFNRVKKYNLSWVRNGHRTGDNFHNVSCTINYKPEEVEELKKIMWEERLTYSGISLLPFDGGSYQQAPFEACDEETYLKYETLVKDVDFTKAIELEDNTDRIGELACSGGVCEFK